MLTHPRQVGRFHEVLVEEIERSAPRYLNGSFTVAEIYQSLIPYRTHRDRLGVEINGDYEDALLRLLAGEGDFLLLESEPARARIQKELRSSNPNTGIFREFAAVSVRLNPRRLPERSQPSGNEKGSAYQPSLGAQDDDEPTATREEDGNLPLDPIFDREGEADEAPTADLRWSAPPRGDVAEASAGADETRPSAGGATRAAGVTGTGEDAVERESRQSECPECDASLPDRESLRFCPFCGANVFVVPCAECGEVLERAWQFCVACGTPAGS